MLHEVLRPFGGPSGPLEQGAIVDVSAWRPQNVKGLVSTRYLRPLTMPIELMPVDAGDGDVEPEGVGPAAKPGRKSKARDKEEAGVWP